MSLHVTGFDTQDLRKGLASLAAQAQLRSGSFFAGIRTRARAEVMGHQRRQEGPAGERWPDRRRGRKGRRVLGQLPGSFSWSADNDGVVAEQRVPWAYVHHEGGRAGRGSRIPARPFAGFRGTFREQVRLAWLAWVARGW